MHMPKSNLALTGVGTRAVHGLATAMGLHMVTMAWHCTWHCATALAPGAVSMAGVLRKCRGIELWFSGRRFTDIYLALIN